MSGSVEDRDEAAAEEGREVSVGLVTDPDTPEAVAERLATELPPQLGDGRQWTVAVEVDPVTAGKRSTDEMLRATRKRLGHRRWDYAICVTDLPVRAGQRPVLAEANRNERVGVVSLPSLAGVKPFGRACRVVIQLLDELTGPSGSWRAGGAPGSPLGT